MESLDIGEEDEFNQQLIYLTTSMEYIMNFLSRKGEMGKIDSEAQSFLLHYKIFLLQTKVERLQVAFNTLHLNMEKVLYLLDRRISKVEKEFDAKFCEQKAYFPISLVVVDFEDIVGLTSFPSHPQIVYSEVGTFVGLKI